MGSVLGLMSDTIEYQYVSQPHSGFTPLQGVSCPIQMHSQIEFPPFASLKNLIENTNMQIPCVSFDDYDPISMSAMYLLSAPLCIGWVAFGLSDPHIT